MDRIYFRYMDGNKKNNVIPIIQWVLSALVIPTIGWAWSINSTVAVQQEQIKGLQAQVAKAQDNTIKLVEISTNISNLKDNFEDLKDMLRSKQ